MKRASTSTENSSLGKGRGGGGASQPPSIENRNGERTSNAAERKGGKCETGNEKDEGPHTRTL